MHKTKNDSSSKAARMQRAYLKEREQQELIEVDLNRAQIFLVDKNGKLIRKLYQNEH